MALLKSAPTYGTFAFDVPEPDKIEGKFVYNYFLPDERESSNPLSDVEAMARHGQTPARQVTVTFTPLEQITTLLPRYTGPTARSNLASFFTRAISEIQVQNENTAFVAVQDDDLAAELQAIIDAELIKQDAAERGLSPLEAVLKYNSISSDIINADDILDVTDIEASSNLTYYDPATGEDITAQKQGGTSEYAIGGFYNKKFIYDILQGSENTPFSPLWGTVGSILSSAAEIQELATSTIDSNMGNMAEYEFSASPVDEQFIPSSTIPSTVEVAGYVIFKYQVNADGSTTLLDRIPLASMSLSQWVDTQIKYGETYRYQIQSLFYLSTVGGSISAAGDTYYTYLMGSRGSPYIDVVCVETVPPPPPTNIEFFLSQEQDMMIVWDMPFNTQEDIKRYQIFRRASLEVPYTIIAELDFDDSTIQTDRTEFIPEYSKMVKDSQVTVFIDSDFEFDVEYYYAICSVDAHDLSSPYSTQFKVQYDRIEGKMEILTVAFSGAPKAYPNFTLKETLIVDCMKDSGHKKMKIYFDPETLVLESPAQYTAGGSIYYVQEDYIETSNTYPMYKVQIINLDRQQDQTLNIYLKESAAFAGSAIGAMIPDVSPPDSTGSTSTVFMSFPVT